uniref:ParB/Sulfiredoxin domain-containing protein n=1 Tax=Panagrolaimus davidi TaxID=227884 RepID=A0A914PYL8_9BILA
MEIVKSRFVRSSAELEGHPAVATRRIKLADLIHDATIRGINASYVEEIISAMITKKWQHDQTLFTVRYDRKTEKYLVLDGNHRLEATICFKTQVGQKKEPKMGNCRKRVKC